jgi:ABC-type transport system involved in multi-copper enzyme maturation permease subunit
VVGLIRAEFRKLLTTQVWLWMLLLCIALTALVVVANIAGEPSDLVLATHVRDVMVSATSSFTYVPIFVLGALAVTTEYRYQTITPTVLATPSRWALITAKLITYAIVGALYALVCLAIQLAMALPWLSGRNIHVSLSNQKGALLATFAVLALFALVGLGAGALLRNQIVAVSVGTIFILILARLVVIIPGVKYIYPYLPTGAVDSIIVDPHDTTNRVINHVHLISAGAGIAVLVVWGLGMAILGAGITMNRDIT